LFTIKRVKGGAVMKVFSTIAVTICLFVGFVSGHAQEIQGTDQQPQECLLHTTWELAISTPDEDGCCPDERKEEYVPFKALMERSRKGELTPQERDTRLGELQGILCLHRTGYLSKTEYETMALNIVKR
jgi:hypothetical protein